MRDLSTKINDSAPANTGYIDAGEFNSTQDELENAVTSAPGGQTLDAGSGPDTSTSMLAQSIARHAAGGAIYCTATGSASAHVVSMADANVAAPSVLFKGLTCRYDPPADNASSAVTVNAFGLGAKPLVNHVSAPLSSTEIDGRVIDIFYDPAIGSGSWVLPAWSNALFVGQTPTSPPSVSSGEGVEVDGSNQANLNFGGLAGDGTPQSDDIFAFLDDADSVHKGITYAQLAALLGTGGGIKGVQFLTTSGTYTKTVGTVSALVFATAGGAGGYGGAGRASGGGAGGTAINFVDLSGVPTVDATIGAGGTGGTGGADGTAGGSTSFGSYASATGGAPGMAFDGLDTPGGYGGVGTIGLIKLGGDAGGHARPGYHGGPGGASFWGGAGQGGHLLTNTSHPLNHGSGHAATGYGSGGGGSDSMNGEGSGGAGMQGCVLVLEFG